MIENILEEREKTHGSFTEQAETAQILKVVMQATPNWKKMPCYMQEALELIATKISRAGHGDFTHQDTFDDISGYATLITRGLENDRIL